MLSINKKSSKRKKNIMKTIKNNSSNLVKNIMKTIKNNSSKRIINIARLKDKKKFTKSVQNKRIRLKIESSNT